MNPWHRCDPRRSRMFCSSDGVTELPEWALCLQLTSHRITFAPPGPKRSSSTIISRPPSAPRSGCWTILNPSEWRNSRAKNSKRSRSAPAWAGGISLKSNAAMICYLIVSRRVALIQLPGNVRHRCRSANQQTSQTTALSRKPKFPFSLSFPLPPNNRTLKSWQCRQPRFWAHTSPRRP